MASILAALAIAPALPAGVDPEVLAAVERVVEEAGGYQIVESWVEDVLEAEGAGPPPRSGRWLPAIAIRASWSPPHRYEVVLCASWPL